MAMASDLRFGTARAKTRFLSRGSASPDATWCCALLPRIIGQAGQRETVVHRTLDVV